MRVLVCGGRDFGSVPKGCPDDQYRTYSERAQFQRFLLDETLNVLNQETAIFVIIHGRRIWGR